ncbi:hypothetical protein KFL_000510300 [Klebsormidium nitens]|uniref:Calcineurin-binding protein cabin-1 n=1 Tax=Klebsormidium nitens TaxID=105231 RepID=A0A1Y1HT04_KLENI|nr:hypothetical protein KFL_000510300 [Klebsormidium nitens]|eukprot:GAQ80329.1 hypothetical protein KFL_000510300 [Klebsormidium nitens]
MFSIASINDEQGQTPQQQLGPTKEAQEFRLAQMYQDALVHMQKGQKNEARPLFEAILRDRLYAQGEAHAPLESNTLLQLRFLSLKNLAGLHAASPSRADKLEGLRCYFQAAAIDDKDVVVWHRAGALASAVGRLDVARKSFEQGLKCSPKHWGCLEKLTEVLLAIGDEVGCEKLVRRILRMDSQHRRSNEIVQAIQGGLFIREETGVEAAVGKGEKSALAAGSLVKKGMPSETEPDAGADVAPQGKEEERGLGFAFDALEPRLSDSPRRRVPAVQREELAGLKLRLARPEWSALVLELQNAINGAGKGLESETDGGSQRLDTDSKAVSEQRSAAEGPVESKVEGEREAGEETSLATASDRASGGDNPLSLPGEGRPAGLNRGEAQGDEGETNGTEKNGIKSTRTGVTGIEGRAWTLQTPLVFEIAKGGDLGRDMQAKITEPVTVPSAATLNVASSPAQVPDRAESGKVEPGNEPEKLNDVELQGVEAGGASRSAGEKEGERALDAVVTEAAETSCKAADQIDTKEELPKNGVEGSAEHTAQVVEAVTLLEGTIVIDLEQASAGSPEQGVDSGGEPKDGTGGTAVVRPNEGREKNESARVVSPTKAKGREGGAEKRERRMTRALRERGSKEKEKKVDGKKKEAVRKEAEAPEPKDVWATLGRFVVGGPGQGSKVTGAADGSKSITNGETNGKGGVEQSKQGEGQIETGQGEATFKDGKRNAVDAPLSTSAGFEAFLDAVEANSGALDVGPRLLEQLAARADVALDSTSIDALLLVESLMRNWGAERSPQCSLWLAQLHLDRAEKREDGETPESSRERTEAAAREGNRCLCEVVEWWAVRNAEEGIEFGGVLQPGEGPPREGGETDRNADDTSAGRGAGGWAIEESVNALDWRFWAKFQWAASRLAFLEGKRARGIECVHECAKLMELTTSADVQTEEANAAAELAGKAGEKGVDGISSPMDVESPTFPGGQLKGREDNKVSTPTPQLTSQSLPRGAPETLQLGCGLRRPTLALSDVRGKLQELETDELLTRSVAALREAGDSEGLVCLLAPVVLPGWEAPDDIDPPSADVSRGGVNIPGRMTPADVRNGAPGRGTPDDVSNEVPRQGISAEAGATKSAPSKTLVADVSRHPPALDTRRRLEALRALLDACRKGGPGYLPTELRARGEVLEILARVSGWLDGSREAWLEFDIEGVFGGVGAAGVLGGGSVEERAERMQRVGRLIGAELRAVGVCAQGLREAWRKARSKSVAGLGAEHFAPLQRLLLDIVAKLYTSGRLSKPKPATAARSDSTMLIDGLVAFCRLQHLTLLGGKQSPPAGAQIPAESAAVSQQVALLASAHRLLADKGLCCAGDGGAPFLKMAIQLLTGLDARLAALVGAKRDADVREGAEVASGEEARAGAKRKLEGGESPGRVKRLRLGTGGDSPLSDARFYGPDSPDAGRFGKERLGPAKKRLERSASQRQIRFSRADASPVKAPDGSTVVDADRVADGRSAQNLDGLSNGNLDGSPIGVAGGTLNGNADESENGDEILAGLRRETGLAAELNQAFFCLYGLNLQEGAGQPKLEKHENTSKGDFGTQEQCAEVMRYIVPYAESCSPDRLKAHLQEVLQAIHKQFPQPPPEVLARFSVEPFLEGKVPLGSVGGQAELQSTGAAPAVGTVQGQAFPGQKGAVVQSSQVKGNTGRETTGSSVKPASLRLALSPSTSPESGRPEREPVHTGTATSPGIPRDAVQTATQRTVTFDDSVRAASDGVQTSIEGVRNPPEAVRTAPQPVRILPDGVHRGVEGVRTADADIRKAAADVRKAGPFAEVYSKLYFLLAQVEEINAGLEAPGFALSDEGRRYFDRMQSYYKYDLCYHPQRLASWERLAEIYDEEVDLLLNDGGKQFTAQQWREDPSRMARVASGRKACRQASLRALALAPTEDKKYELERWNGSVLYDVIQDVVPLSDQRRIQLPRDDTWRALCSEALGHFERSYVCSNDWELLIPLGRLSQKLGRPTSEALDLYGRASDSAGLVVLPVYRLHASRAKLLCELRSRPVTWSAIQDLRVLDGGLTSGEQLTSEGALTSKEMPSADAGKGAGGESDVWEGLKAVARHCFLPATARKLRGLAMKAEVRGPYVGEQSDEEKAGEGKALEETVQKSGGKSLEKEAQDEETNVEKSSPAGVQVNTQGADERMEIRMESMETPDMIGEADLLEKRAGLMEVEGGADIQVGTGEAGTDVDEKRPEIRATGPEVTDTDVENEGRRSGDAKPAAAAPPAEISRLSHEDAKPAASAPLAEVWRVLHEDAVAGLRFCIFNELKHFHKARFRVAHALLVGAGGELERAAVDAAKTELEFFFRTAKGAFCVNVWELDAQKKKKAATLPCGRRVHVEQSLAESARKFATCVRKYLMLYLRLCELTSDWEALERAAHFLRTDKKYSFFLSDLAQLAMGLYVAVLAAAIRRAQLRPGAETLKPLLEQAFGVWLENAGNWKATVLKALEEVKLGRELREPIAGVQEEDFFRYSSSYIDSLARAHNAPALGAAYERLRKRSRSHRCTADNGTLALCRKASAAWAAALAETLEDLEGLAESEKRSRATASDKEGLEDGGRTGEVLAAETGNAEKAANEGEEGTRVREGLPEVQSSREPISEGSKEARHEASGAAADERHVSGASEERGEKRKRASEELEEATLGKSPATTSSLEGPKRHRGDSPTAVPTLGSVSDPAATVEGGEDSRAAKRSRVAEQERNEGPETERTDVTEIQTAAAGPGKETGAGSAPTSPGVSLAAPHDGSTQKILSPVVGGGREDSPVAAATRRSRRSVEGGVETPGKSHPLLRALGARSHSRKQGELGEGGRSQSQRASAEAPDKEQPAGVKNLTESDEGPEWKARAVSVLKSALAMYRDLVSVLGPVLTVASGDGKAKAEHDLEQEKDKAEEKRQAEAMLLRAFALVHAREAAGVDEVLRLHEEVPKKRLKKAGAIRRD